MLGCSLAGCSLLEKKEKADPDDAGSALVAATDAAVVATSSPSAGTTVVTATATATATAAAGLRGTKAAAAAKPTCKADEVPAGPPDAPCMRSCVTT